MPLYPSVSGIWTREMVLGVGGESWSSSSHFPCQSPTFRKRATPPPVLRTNFNGGRTATFAFPLFPNSARSRNEVIHAAKADLSESNAKKANLFARRKERIKLPNYDDGCGRLYHISEFLSHPSGVEAILNTSALQNFQSLDSNTFRCTLPKIQLLNFEVAPVLDLRVTPTIEDCTVELLSCKFEGSEVVERQNDHFSASMKNYITWDANGSEPCLDVDVKLNLTLEIYTQPFTMLPKSAVENPGNLIMQALVDRLVPMLLQQLLQDYDKWVQEQYEYSTGNN